MERQAFHSGEWWEPEKRQAQIETREVPTGKKEKLFRGQESPALEQAAQTGCAVSILRGFQEQVCSLKTKP